LIGRNMSMMARTTLTEGYPILRWVQISSFSIDGARYLASCVLAPSPKLPIKAAKAWTFVQELCKSCTHPPATTPPLRIRIRQKKVQPRQGSLQRWVLNSTDVRSLAPNAQTQLSHSLALRAR